VDFWLDNSYLGRTQVSPFSLKWNITMHDSFSPTLRAALSLPVDSPTVPVLSYQATTRKLEDDGKTVNTITETLAATMTKKADRVVGVFPNGFGVIADSGGYTETHTVRVKAYDAAGNSVESANVRFLVSHRPKPQPEGQQGLNWFWDDRQVLALSAIDKTGWFGRRQDY
jgi:hypothetical protein